VGEINLAIRDGGGRHPFRPLGPRNIVCCGDPPGPQVDDFACAACCRGLSARNEFDSATFTFAEPPAFFSSQSIHRRYSQKIAAETRHRQFQGMDGYVSRPRTSR
jgi:hypothetical protein